jgi:hypothetical protein
MKNNSKKISKKLKKEMLFVHLRGLPRRGV